MVGRFALLFVRFSHDKILYVCKRVMLVLFWEFAERVMLIEILHYMGVEGERMLVCCVRDWPVRAEETWLDMFVGKRDTSEEFSLGGSAY